MKKISRKAFIVDIITLIVAGVALDAVWMEKFFIETNEFFLGNANPDSDNIRIVQISDLHLNKIGLQHTYLAEKINKLNPHLICFTGDTVDRLKSLPLLDEYLHTFNTKIKKIAILGNREYRGGVKIEELREIYQKHNVDLLVNQSRKYQFGRSSVSVTGIDDLVAGHADFKKAMEGFHPADHHIVLTHCPLHHQDIVKEQGNTPIDFILSGHTHGGQVNFFGHVPFKPYGSGKYLSGWYREEQPHIYVSKGVGTTSLPVRFGARAEIAIFNLESKNSV